jgi:hypothetical protein
VHIAGHGLRSPPGLGWLLLVLNKLSGIQSLAGVRFIICARAVGTFFTTRISENASKDGRRAL